MCINNQSEWKLTTEKKTVYVVRVVKNGKILSPFGNQEWEIGKLVIAQPCVNEFKQEVEMLHSFKEFRDAKAYMATVRSLSVKCKNKYELAIFEAEIGKRERYCEGEQNTYPAGNVLNGVGSEVLTLVEKLYSKEYEEYNWSTLAA